MNEETARAWGETLGASPVSILAYLAALAIALSGALALLTAWARRRKLGWRSALVGWTRKLHLSRGAARRSGARDEEDVPKQQLVTRIEVLGLHLGLGLAFALAVAGFFTIAAWVTAGGAVTAFDLALASAVHRSSPAWLTKAMLVFTDSGGGFGVLVIALVGALALVLSRRYVLALGFAIAEAGAGVINSAMKSAYRRPRPTFEDPFTIATGWSFPSGHAMATLITAGMLAYVASRFVRRARFRLAIFFLATLWTLGIGFSRICLGVHYASDVVGGYAAGTLWLAICVSAIDVATARDRRAADLPQS